MLKSDDVKELSEHLAEDQLVYVGMLVDPSEVLSVKNRLQERGFKSFIRTASFGIELVVTDRVESEDA